MLNIKQLPVIDIADILKDFNLTTVYDFNFSYETEDEYIPLDLSETALEVLYDEAEWRVGSEEHCLQCRRAYKNILNQIQLVTTLRKQYNLTDMVLIYIDWSKYE